MPEQCAGVAPACERELTLNCHPVNPLYKITSQPTIYTLKTTNMEKHAEAPQ